MISQTNKNKNKNKMAWGMLAGHCRNVIIASVKQGEVKKQERVVLYLADYPHASSRLQGERADSLNRQEQAEHRPHFVCRNTRKHTFSLSLNFLLLSSTRGHTHTRAQAFTQGNKKVKDFQTIQIGNTVQTSIFLRGFKQYTGQGNKIHRYFKDCI